jgi:hypothetical protein
MCHLLQNGLVMWRLELHSIICFDKDAILWLVSLLREHVGIHPWQLPLLWRIALDQRVRQPEEVRQRIRRVLQYEELCQRIRGLLQAEELRQQIRGLLQPEELCQRIRGYFNLRSSISGSEGYFNLRNSVSSNQSVFIHITIQLIILIFLYATPSAKPIKTFACLFKD